MPDSNNSEQRPSPMPTSESRALGPVRSERPLLRLIPLDDTVVFPGMGVTLPIEVGNDGRVVLLSGQHRALIGAARTGPEGELRVEVDERPDEENAPARPGRVRQLEREYRAVVEEILELRGDDGRIAAFIRAIVDPGPLADSAGYSPNLSYEQKVELLRTLPIDERLE